MSHCHTNNITIKNNLHIYYISFDLLNNGYGQVKINFIMNYLTIFLLSLLEQMS